MHIQVYLKVLWKHYTMYMVNVSIQYHQLYKFNSRVIKSSV